MLLDFVPSIRSWLVPCPDESPLFVARLGKLLIAFCQMDKVVMAQQLKGSTWLWWCWDCPGQAWLIDPALVHGMIRWSLTRQRVRAEFGRRGTWYHSLGLWGEPGCPLQAFPWTYEEILVFLESPGGAAPWSCSLQQLLGKWSAEFLTTTEAEQTFKQLW